MLLGQVDGPHAALAEHVDQPEWTEVLGQIETVAGLLQMKHGKLHPSINVEDQDEQIDLDVCANEAVDHEIQIMLKNSFGFGGLNCCALFQRFDKASL